MTTRWMTTVGESLQYLREEGNREDCFAVGVYKGTDIVDHIHRSSTNLYH